MSTSNHTSPEHQFNNNTHKASVTFLSSIREPFNILMIFMPFTMILSSLYVIINSGGSVVFAVILALAAIFIFFQLWAMISTTIELTSKGIEYYITYQHVSVLWDDIDTVKFEPRKKQITFWSKGKMKRLHEFGFPPEEYNSLKEIMLYELRRRQVKFL